MTGGSEISLPPATCYKGPVILEKYFRFPSLKRTPYYPLFSSPYPCENHHPRPSDAACSTTYFEIENEDGVLNGEFHRIVPAKRFHQASLG